MLKKGKEISSQGEKKEEIHKKKQGKEGQVELGEDLDITFFEPLAADIPGSVHAAYCLKQTLLRSNNFKSLTRRGQGILPGASCFQEKQSSSLFVDLILVQRIAKGAGGKGPRQKTSKTVKKCQNVFRHFSTIFAQGKKTSKIVQKRQKVFRHFLTVFARHHFSGPFWVDQETFSFGRFLSI